MEEIPQEHISGDQHSTRHPASRQELDREFEQEPTYNNQNIRLGQSSRRHGQLSVSCGARSGARQTGGQLLEDNQQQKTTDPEEEDKDKEKKQITTKTMAHGLMDISLLTSNATQLRTVLSNPGHEFYTFLLILISISICLQILSGSLMILADYYKTLVKHKDRRNQKKRKRLNFVVLAMILFITALNIMISAFYTQNSPTVIRHEQVPEFRQHFSGPVFNHTEL